MKTKSLIRFAVTVQLICDFDFAYVKSSFLVRCLNVNTYDVNVYSGLLAGISIGCTAVIGLTVLFCKFKSHLKQWCRGEDESDDEGTDQVKLIAY